MRELQNVIRQSVLQTTGPVLLADFLPESLRAGQDRGNARQRPGARGRFAGPVHRRSGCGPARRHLYDEVVGRVEARLIERALSYTGGDKLEAISLLGTNPATLRSMAALALLDLEPRSSAGGGGLDALIQPGMTMEDIEKEAIRRALAHTHGRRTEASQLLGLSIRTLQRKIKNTICNSVGRSNPSRHRIGFFTSNSRQWVRHTA